MSTYAWIIDRDYLAEAELRGCGKAEDNAKGVVGPSDASDLAIEVLRSTKVGHVFRMLDGDGEVYYRGRIIVADGEAPELYVPRRGYAAEDIKRGRFIASVPWDEAEAFGPLWDFGTPNAGCTELQYRVAGPDGPVWATV